MTRVSLIWQCGTLVSVFYALCRHVQFFNAYDCQVPDARITEGMARARQLEVMLFGPILSLS